MKKMLLLGALLTAGALSFPEIGHGHGGTYPGPGDTVPPPSGGGPGSGGAPPTPGPAPPPAPGPSGGNTGGGAITGAPGGGGPARTGGPQIGTDLTTWEFWWVFNKAPYLNLRAAIHTPATSTGDDAFFLGFGQTIGPEETLAPTDAQIRDRIVPALLRALETESDNDIVTACLIALARIGDEREENGVSEFETVIRDYLSDPVLEIAETAAIALGILGNPASIQTLEELFLDTPAGRKLVRRENGIPVRIRTFAAYGLGLIGARTEKIEYRRRILEDLYGVVEGGRGSTRDLQVAALIASGLVPLEPGHYTDEVAPVHLAGAPPRDLETQVLWLLDFFESKDSDRAPFLVQAHVPRAVAQLLGDLDGRVVKRAWKSFVTPLTRRGSKGRSVLRQSCALALGQIGDLDQDEKDVAIRAALMKGVEDSDQPVKNFSLIALAQLAERPGEGDEPDSGLADVRGFLMRQLVRGRSGGRAWAGLALGVVERKRLDRGGTPSADSLKAIRESLRDETSPREVGAYAIALGIAGDLESQTLMQEKLRRLSDDTARGHLAVGLGLMKSIDSINLGLMTE